VPGPLQRPVDPFEDAVGGQERVVARSFVVFMANVAGTPDTRNVPLAAYVAARPRIGGQLEDGGIV